jgi:hypothetical protein
MDGTKKSGGTPTNDDYFFIFHVIIILEMGSLNKAILKRNTFINY